MKTAQRGDLESVDGVDGSMADLDADDLKPYCGGNALGNEFLPDPNDLRHVRHYALTLRCITRANRIDELMTAALTVRH